jgi:hypothetical protein
MAGVEHAPRHRLAHTAKPDESGFHAHLLTSGVFGRTELGSIIARSFNRATKQSKFCANGPGLLRFARNDGSISQHLD